MQFATQASARVHAGTVGHSAASVAALHPPTITLTLDLPLTYSRPGGGEYHFGRNQSLECVVGKGTIASVERGLIGDVHACQSFVPTDLVRSDGVIVSEATRLFNREHFGDKLQVWGRFSGIFPARLLHAPALLLNV